jgi:hypothetical protein
MSMTRVQSPQDAGILISAAVINTIVMGFVFWKQWKLIGSEQENYVDSTNNQSTSNRYA